MAIVTTDNQHYTDIAAAIRSKNGTETQYKPSEMAAAISAISGGGEPEPPDDGKTRLYITVPANAIPDRPPPRNQVPLYIQQTVANGVTIDWGDGTTPETLPGTGAVNTTHIYEQGGNYVISLDPAEGCELGFGASNKDYCIMGQLVFNYINNPTVYCYMLKKVTIGKNVPDIDRYSFQYCRSITYVSSTYGTTSIEGSAFQYCSSLASALISNTVKRISEYGFYYCGWLKEVHFLSPTPPTLGGTNVFTGIPSDCIIYVPVGSLEAYQTATNWTTVADHIQEEPA